MNGLVLTAAAVDADSEVNKSCATEAARAHNLKKVSNVVYCTSYCLSAEEGIAIYRDRSVCDTWVLLLLEVLQAFIVGHVPRHSPRLACQWL